MSDGGRLKEIELRVPAHVGNGEEDRAYLVAAEEARERARRKSRRRLYRRKIRRRRALTLCGLVGLVFLVLALGTLGGDAVVVSGTPTTGSRLVPPAPDGDFGTEVSQIAAVYPGRYGVVVYDPESGESSGVNETEPFEAASLAKLPVLLTLYRGAAENRIDLDEKISVTPADVQTYGTGEIGKRSIGSTMTLRECARAMIHSSDNTAWVMLERRLGKNNVAAEISSLGLTGTDYASLTTTPKDVLAMLEAVSDPGYTSPELSGEMLDFMTDTEFETRIPAALPEDVRVAHKIGSLGNTFSDAGIVFRGPDKEEVDYVLVVITEGMKIEKTAEEAIRKVSFAAYNDF